jgi:hypothetical protein
LLRGSGHHGAASTVRKFVWAMSLPPSQRTIPKNQRLSPARCKIDHKIVEAERIISPLVREEMVVGARSGGERVERLSGTQELSATSGLSVPATATPLGSELTARQKWKQFAEARPSARPMRPRKCHNNCPLTERSHLCRL